MHTRLLVCRRFSGWLLIVVRHLVLHWWDPAEAVHEPGGVVPMGPVGGEEFDVGQEAQWTPSKRCVIAHGFGLVQPDRGLSQGIVSRRQLRLIR